MIANRCFSGIVPRLSPDMDRMVAVCFRGMRQLRSVICLQNVWSVAEEFNCSFEKIHRAEATLFFLRVDEPIPRRFIYDGILVEFSPVFSGITRIWHIFHVHLPFFAEGCRRIVFVGMLDFFLCRFRFLPEPEADKYTVQGAGVTAVGFFFASFSVSFAGRDVRVSTMGITNPL